MKSDDTKEKTHLFYLKIAVYAKERCAFPPPLISGFPNTLYIERGTSKHREEGLRNAVPSLCRFFLEGGGLCFSSWGMCRPS